MITETPVLEFFLNKTAGLQSVTFIKKKPRQRYFTVNIAKFSGSSFL